MADHQDKEQPDQLDRVSDELVRSLKACHSIIDDYRSKLAANLNDPAAANEDEQLGRRKGDDSRLA